MQQTLQQAVQRDIAQHKCDITLHAALPAFVSTRSKKSLERENDIENACSAVCSTARCAARHAARCCVPEIGRGICCTSKTHVIAADGSLDIQTARSKRKCNRPLKNNDKCRHCMVEYIYLVLLFLLINIGTIFFTQNSVGTSVDIRHEAVLDVLLLLLFFLCRVISPWTRVDSQACFLSLPLLDHSWEEPY
jgi:hypothetical protein